MNIKRRRVFALVFFPSQIVFFRRFDCAVAQAFGIVARNYELHCGEKRLDKTILLIVEILPDAFGDADRAALEFQHADGDSVNIQHNVRAFAVFARHGNFFSKRKIVT